MGIVSPLGNALDKVAVALRDGHCGISFVEKYASLNLGSQVAGLPDMSGLPVIDRRLRRFMGSVGRYAYHAMRMAVEDAVMAPADISHPRTGLIVGSGVGSSEDQTESLDILREQGVGKVAPYSVPRIMGSTTSAVLATAFHIRGISYSIVSACATSAHSIGHGMELIQSGKQDCVFAGGAEDPYWQMAANFDAMGALSSKYNATPGSASRPYDLHRDGFVLAGGGGVVVLEELERARKRGARIYAEVIGYGASSDGEDMVTPSQDGAVRVMRSALEGVNEPIDYINTHGTSTPIGDLSEVRAMQEVFGRDMPRFSSTKGLTGHPIGASGVHDAIYSLLMMRDGFLAGTATIETVDPAFDGLPLLTRSIEFSPKVVMSNSFGFGGTNASLVFRRFAS
jgi:3-oxoacyl-[acyl-carrier-protein] synthase-1